MQHAPVINPWLSIWIRPRRTIRTLLETEPERAVLLLAAVGGVAESLNRASSSGLGDRIPYDVVLALAVAIGPLAGILTLFLGGYILSWTGHWIGGQGTAEDVRTALAWANVPVLGILALWVIEIAFIGSELFTTATPRLDSNPLLATSFLMFFLGQMVFGIWALVILLNGLGEAHRFSAWRAAGSLLLSLVFVVVPIVLVMFVVVGFSM